MITDSFYIIQPLIELKSVTILDLNGLICIEANSSWQKHSFFEHWLKVLFWNHWKIWFQHKTSALSLCWIYICTNWFSIKDKTLNVFYFFEKLKTFYENSHYISYSHSIIKKSFVALTPLASINSMSISM